MTVVLGAPGVVLNVRIHKLTSDRVFVRGGHQWRPVFRVNLNGRNMQKTFHNPELSSRRGNHRGLFKDQVVNSQSHRFEKDAPVETLAVCTFHWTLFCS